MTVTPAVAARQIRTARKVNRVQPNRVVYRTATGEMPTDLRTGQRLVEVPVVSVEDDPHCFVCHRHTDHFAEHDDMVEAGTARYGEDGSVYPVPWRWDD